MTADPFLTMGDISRIYQVHLRTARRWAAQDQWRRATGKPAMYSLADAQASYERRRNDGRQRRPARPRNTRLTIPLDQH